MQRNEFSQHARERGTGYVWWRMLENRGLCFILLRVCIAWNEYLSAVRCDKNVAWSGVKSCCWPAVPTCDLQTMLTLSFHEFTKCTDGRNVQHCFFFCFCYEDAHSLKNKLNRWYVPPYQSQRHHVDCGKISTVFCRLANQTSFQSYEITCFLDALRHCGIEKFSC